MSTREAHNVLWEAMVGELRATFADINNRRHFTPEKQPITDARALVAEMLTPTVAINPMARSAQTASALNAADEAGFIEVG